MSQGTNDDRSTRGAAGPPGRLNGAGAERAETAGGSLGAHAADTARLLRAAAELHSAHTEEEALRVVCAAMQDTGWGRVSAYAYTPEWQLAAAAFVGLTPDEQDELRHSRATVEQRRAMFGPACATFRVSRSYLIPAERRGELSDPSPVVPSHQPPAAERTWHPRDVAYTPLCRVDGSPIGLVMYDDPVTQERPDQEAFRYIEFFADAAARVIEQIRTTERLRRTEYRLTALLDSMPDVVFYEGDERPTLISRNLQSLLGVSAEEVQQSPHGLSGLVDPRDAERVRARQAQWERDGAPGTLITRARMRTAEGSYRWIENRAVSLPGGFGRDLGRHRAGVMIDVTEQVRTEEALREREERFRLVTLATRDTIYDWNVRTGVVWRNEALAEIVGEPPDSAEISWWHERIHPDDRERVAAAMSSAMKGGRPRWEAEYRIRRADGRYARVQDRGFLVREGGEVVRVIGAMSDITARKLAEERQALMVRELDHRVKNNLAAVGVLAQQSLRAAPTLEHFERSFTGRLRALARTHGVLAESQGQGAPLGSIVRQTLEPYTIDESRRLMVNGEEVMLPARMAAPLALALNELATNAVKYGALSVPEGWVGVGWKQVKDTEFGPSLRIEWSEHAGPPVEPPQSAGFGTKLIADEVKFQLRGRSEVSYDPAGVRCVITAPVRGAEVTPATDGEGRPQEPPAP